MPYKIGSGGVAGAVIGRGRGGGRVLERTHSLSYSATVNKLLLDIESEQTEGSVKADTAGDIVIQNSGGTPAFAILAYRLWTTATSMSATTYHVNYLLKPGEAICFPDSPAVISDDGIEQLAGTAVDNLTPDSNMFTDSEVDINAGEGGSHVIGSASATNLWLPEGGWTDQTNGVHLRFRVGDLIRVGNEIMEVTEVGSGADGTTNNYLTVIRGVHGSTAVDTHTNGDDIRFPFFNAHHDFDKYSVAQTDSSGQYRALNFMGQGRASTNLQGITPGSVGIKFFTLGAYQELGLQNITSSTNSGLTAGGTAYAFDIQVDGGTNFDNLTFTTDSSNVRFGGTNGVLSKIQDALDTQFYTAGNLFEKKVTVGIVNGDIRFTSGSNLSTSAIALTAEDGSDASFFGTGRIPAIGNIDAAIPARLPDDVYYDPITYDQIPSDVFAYDNGNGVIFGRCSGTINYETGAIDLIGCPPNAQFVVTCLHTSAFSGKQNATDAAKMNTLKAIYGNVPNQKWKGELTVSRV